MNGKPIRQEQYVKGSDVINYVVYRRTTGAGSDEVLQHKINGTSETAHLTLHPDGSVNFRVKRTKIYLQIAVRNKLAGFSPALSPGVKQFISRVQSQI